MYRFYFSVNVLLRLFNVKTWAGLMFLMGIGFMVLPTASAADAVTPMEIQGYIAHAEPAKALDALAPILKNDPHSAKAWYLQAEALDALGRDAQAKTALSTAEHLSPAMAFANARDLKALEKRVGLQNVQSVRNASARNRDIIWAQLALAVLGIVIFVYIRNKSRKAGALAESSRQDVLLEITQFLTGELDSARITADAQGDSLKLTAIEGWQKSLVDCAQTLKNVADSDTDAKNEAIANARDLLADVRRKLSGKHSDASVIHPFNAGESMQSSPFPSSSYQGSAVVQPAAYQGGNMGSNMRGNPGGGLGSALEQGLGMGLGMEVAEELLGGDRSLFGNNDDDSVAGGFVDDGFSGGTDDGLDGGNSFGGGADDGLDSGGDDFGSADDGLDDGGDSW